MINQSINCCHTSTSGLAPRRRRFHRRSNTTQQSPRRRPPPIPKFSNPMRSAAFNKRSEYLHFCCTSHWNRHSRRSDSAPKMRRTLLGRWSSVTLYDCAPKGDFDEYPIGAVEVRECMALDSYCMSQIVALVGGLFWTENSP